KARSSPSASPRPGSFLVSILKASKRVGVCFLSVLAFHLSTLKPRTAQREDRPGLFSVPGSLDDLRAVQRGSLPLETCHEIARNPSVLRCHGHCCRAETPT